MIIDIKTPGRIRSVDTKYIVTCVQYPEEPTNIGIISCAGEKGWTYKFETAEDAAKCVAKIEEAKRLDIVLSAFTVTFETVDGYAEFVSKMHRLLEEKYE